MKANSVQVGGDHYKEGGEFQHWDFVPIWLDNKYFEGNITKYIWRYKKKNGRQDLEKALHYSNKLKECFLQGCVKPRGWDVIPTETYFSANDLDSEQKEITLLVLNWNSEVDLDSIIIFITKMIEEWDACEPSSSYVNQG